VRFCSESASDHAWARRIWPTAAAACFSSSFSLAPVRLSFWRASEMAPDETTMTSVPRVARAAISAVTLCSQAVRGAAVAGSTISALPILTTMRRALARTGVIFAGIP